MKRLLMILIIVISSSVSVLAGGIDCHRFECADSLLREKIDSLQIVLDNLMPIRRRLAEDMQKKYGDYSVRKFRDMNIRLLDSLIVDGRRLAIDDLSDFIDDMTVAQQNLQDFLRIDSVLNKPYDKALVDGVKPLCDSLVRKVAGSQQQEVKALSNGLDKYQMAMISMRDLVEWIHDTMDLYRPDGNPAAARTTLNGIFSNQANIINNEINAVPYLKTQLGKLKKELQDNPLRQGETETQLIELLNLNK